MEGLGSLLFFAIFFYIMMRYGCGAHMMHGHGKGHHGHGIAKKYIDPVCEKDVETEKGYGRMYQGMLYRFCSKSCLDKFDVDPERYSSIEINKPQG